MTIGFDCIWLYYEITRVKLKYQQVLRNINKHIENLIIIKYNIIVFCCKFADL